MNCLQNAFDVSRHIVVPEANDSVALLLQPPCALGISRHPCFKSMLRAVNLDDQARGHAGKIGNIGTDWNLTAEVSAKHWRALEVLP